MNSTHTRLAAFIAFVCLSVGCSGAPSFGPGFPSTSSVAQANSDRQAPDLSFVLNPNATGEFVYGCGGKACVWYAVGQNKIVGRIWGFSDAQGVGANPKNGDVYVTDDGTSTISVYAPNSKSLIDTISDPGQFPVGVAVDEAGNVFVANALDENGGPGSVTVFNASGKILRTLRDPNAVVGRSVAIGGHDLLLFCFNNQSGEGECDEFPDGRGHGKATALGIGYAGGSAFDAANHFVVIDEVNAVADTFAGSKRCGSYSLAGSNVPIMAAFGRSSRILYTTNTATHGIAAYTYSDCGSGTIHPKIVHNKGLGRYIYLNGVAVTQTPRSR